MSTPTATWDTPALMTALARRGWGELDGRSRQGERRVLYALVALTDHKSGTGEITQAQVADTCGMSIRRVRDVLHSLEDLGLIRYARGWLDTGRPQPGFVWISKRALARLCRKARGWLDARRAKRADDLQQRIAKTLTWSSQVALPRGTVTPRQRKPLSERAEMSAALLLDRGTSPSTRAGEDPRPVDNPTPLEDTMTWQPRIITDHDAQEHDELVAEGAASIHERNVPPSQRPKGRCGICSREWDDHVTRNAKVPVALRHEFERTDKARR